MNYVKKNSSARLIRGNLCSRLKSELAQNLTLASTHSLKFTSSAMNLEKKKESPPESTPQVEAIDKQQIVQIPLPSTEIDSFMGNIAMEPRRRSKTPNSTFAKSSRSDITNQSNSTPKLEMSSTRDTDKIFHRKPSNIRNKSQPRFPTGAFRNTRFPDASSAEMEINFLGTASCIPTWSRGVSCVALRFKNDIFLFDCGEATQMKFQNSSLRPSKIRKIFLTHSHGDHMFGLPGMLCNIGQATMEERDEMSDDGSEIEPIDIYGPEGIRNFVRVAMQVSYNQITAPYRVHELKNVPFLHNKYTRCLNLPQFTTMFNPQYGERQGGRDIYPDENGVYQLDEDDVELSVQAAPMQHSVPCVGYVVREKDHMGRLHVEKVQQLTESNKEELAKRPEFNGDGMRAMGALKELKCDDISTFPSETKVEGSDIVDLPRKGRKIVLMGDTCCGDYIRSISMDADVVVHEATTTYVPFMVTPSEQQQFLRRKDSPAMVVQKDTIAHGHSTPAIAAKFAQDVRAKKLILTHFSSRYTGDAGEVSMNVMWQIEDQARKACHLKGENDVVAAWDHMSINVPLR